MRPLGPPYALEVLQHSVAPVSGSLARSADSDKISPNLLSEQLQFYDFVSGVTENRENPLRARLSMECNRCVTNDDVHIHSFRCLAMGHLITYRVFE